VLITVAFLVAGMVTNLEDLRALIGEVAEQAETVAAGRLARGGGVSTCWGWRVFGCWLWQDRASCPAAAVSSPRVPSIAQDRRFRGSRHR
jgi:hypothetical protein